MGLENIANNIGLGENVDVKLCRLERSGGKGTAAYTIQTDAQLKLEIPLIRTAGHTLQVTVYPKVVCFAGKKERIEIVVRSESGDVACHSTPVVVVEEDINLDEINLVTILILHF